MNTATESVHGLISLPRVLPPHSVELARALARVACVKEGRFPGPSPCSLERADFPKLKTQPYWACEKTDGVRVMLFCTTLGDLRVCCIVDRAMAIYLLPLRAVPTAMFQSSLVDCELVMNASDRVWELLAFDAFILSGVPMFSMPFSRRISCLKRATMPYTAHPDDPVRLRIKDFVAGSMFGMYHEFEATKRQAYAIDGIILTPELSPPVVGRHPDLFKLKTKHTVDFMVGDNGTDLLVFDSSKRTHCVVARLRAPSAPGTIVECGREGGSDVPTWQVVCQRRDKSTANDMLTYTKTLLNMREGVTCDDLVSAFAA